MTIFWLSITSFIGWFLSSLGAGGSSYIIVPMVGFLLGAIAIPPVIATGMLIGNSQRVFLYWQYVNWQVFWYYLPGAITGACLGAFVFSKTKIEWLSLLIGLFLLLSALSHLFKGGKATFQVRLWQFLPAGFVHAFLSGLIGGTGPLLAPFYLNYGLVKEELLATRAINLAVVHFVKIIAYGVFGSLSLNYVVYGLIIGVAAFPGNWLGKLVVEKISVQRFQQLVVSFVMMSGMLMLWEQRQFLLFW